MQRSGLSVGLALVLGAAVAATAGSVDEVVAVVDGTPITGEVLDELIQPQLLELRQREDQLRRSGLDELIAQVLLEREAAARGVSVEELTRVEITEKTSVAPAEAKAFYEANRSRFGAMSEEEALQKIVEGLGRQRQRERRSAFARELRDTHPVEVRLEPLRLPVEPGEAPLRGDAGAPVTIVEFSDFQCPFCVRARPTVNRVREVYGDQVRFAFRHFPLAFHDQAQKAGEAAACAGDQDKFWEMHDLLWKSQGQLQPSVLKENAAALGLDANLFGQCLDSGRHASVVADDAAAGSQLGVTGTPAFFINGRPLVGAQPFEAFAEIIDDELARAARASSGAPGAR
jgi:predicted DsbA family dithiol-disulfide isomerase